MAECYCAKIEDGAVTQVIVCGCAEWAATHLGGEWVCTEERLVGIGWMYQDDDLRPPQPHASWVWEGEWKPPFPPPASGQWHWDESSHSWREWSPQRPAKN